MTRKLLSTCLRKMDSLHCFDSFITPKEKRIFESLCICSLDELLYYFPYKYVSSKQVGSINDIKVVNSDDIISLPGRITNFRMLKSHSGNKKRSSIYLNADFYDKNEVKISVLWFKRIDKIKAAFKNKSTCVLKGVLKRKGDNYFFIHPRILNYGQAVGEKIIPCYPANTQARKCGFKDDLLQRIIVSFIKEKGVEDFIPSYILLKYKLLSREEALLKIHNPSNKEDIHQARRRLKFEELFLLQLKMLHGKVERECGRRGYVCMNKKLLERFYDECIDFTLTNSQGEVIEEIYQDLISGKQMNRLLQGDVGSGKTVVAFASCLIALGSGYQCAIMAPTEVLAQQHFQKLHKYCERLGINIAFISSSVSVKERKKIFDGLLSGDVRMIVGTHSLLSDDVRFNSLGLVIIDEQHKFGVMQRAVFMERQENVYPHMLLMTATPIPRTLALTLYGDYDISVIKELPKNRKPIKTLHCYESHRLRLLNFVREKIDNHQQAYFVYPLIEESEKIDIKNAIEGYEALSRYFSDAHVGIIHGDMDAQAKDMEMQYFKKGFTQILVSTTVIEVGIDVPSATVMVIENAERFGLAQLHQLRGRVGRGDMESFCILVTGFNLTRKQKEKIRAMVNCNNGFEIANVDLKIRGSGNVFGEEQSGNMKLKIADINTDVPIIECARKEAQNILKQLDSYPKLKDKILNGLPVNLRNIG